MRYLITGGCGFIGSNLSAEVLRRNEELFVFDNLSRFGSEINFEWLKSQGEFQFFHSDVRNSNDIERVIKQVRPDVIFHLAGQVAMTTSIDNPRLDFETNTLGTINLLEAVRKFSAESIILYSSTNKVYGDLEYLDYEETSTRYICADFPNGFDETLRLDFRSPYGCSKGAADQYLLDYYRMFGIRTVVFRHSSMYGGRQFATYDQGWVGWFCQKALEVKEGKLKEPFKISGNGKQVRDLLHSDDVVRLYFSSAEEIGSVEGRVFNIGGGNENSLSLLELFDLLEESLNIRLVFRMLPWRVSDQKVFVAANNRITQSIGWSPQIDKAQGVESMISWLGVV